MRYATFLVSSVPVLLFRSELGGPGDQAEVFQDSGTKESFL